MDVRKEVKPRMERRRRRWREYGLTVGTLGSSAGQTLMVALMPVLLASYAPSAVAIGLAVGSEGLFAMLIPYWIGHLSDRLPVRLADRFGRRTFFLALFAPVLAGTLVAVPFVRGYWPLVVVASLFFAALHAYLTPLWTLMVDAVPDRRRGRVHGVRGALHAIGLGYGLVAGGLLFAIWTPLPFLVAAALVVVTTVWTIAAAPRPTRNHEPPVGPAREETARVWREVRGRPEVRGFLTANVLWTGAVDGIRPYVFLFATAVLGITIAEASLVLFFLIAGVGAGAVLVGRLGDRYGRARLLIAGSVVTGVAMAFGIIIRDLPTAFLVLLAAGFGAATFVALPYPVFSRMASGGAAGRYTGLFVLSAGIGRLFAPLVIGAAIDVGTRAFPAYEGYPFMWPIAGGMALVGAWVFHRAVRAARV
ncbi:MAG TPA: MFS transporter [Longimicrobiales bacterium]|nr:MFS transporter [Longimicrobiales bacterium]